MAASLPSESWSSKIARRPERIARRSRRLLKLMTIFQREDVEEIYYDAEEEVQEEVRDEEQFAN